MEIYVFKNNQKAGPFTLEVIQANLKAGIFSAADLCWYDGIPNWTPLATIPDCAPAQSPSPPGMPPVTTIPPPPAAPITPPGSSLAPTAKPNESLGTALVAVPIAAAALTWFWVGNMRLIDGPGSKLGLLTAATLLITAALAATEASKLGIGSEADVAAWNQRSARKSFSLKPPTPVVWFFGFVLLWFLSYPGYLYYRSRYGARNLAAAALVSMVIWFIPLGMVSYGIGTAQEDLNQQIQRLQNYR